MNKKMNNLNGKMNLISTHLNFFLEECLLQYSTQGFIEN